MIENFSYKYAFLSNYAISPITMHDQLWPSVEHIFQAAKTLDKGEREYIRTSGTPSISKRRGKKVQLRDDWQDIKQEIMLKSIRLKFKQNPELKAKLLDTGNEDLIEGNTWHDNIWGDCHCKNCSNIQGTNYLGKILMQVRKELISIDQEGIRYNKDVTNAFEFLPCMYSEQLVSKQKRKMLMGRGEAKAFGQSVVQSIRKGYYHNHQGDRIELSTSIEVAMQNKKTIEPDMQLPEAPKNSRYKTQIQITNETTLEASKRLVDQGQNPLVLNFANGTSPGGGFLSGARAQEETLCRSSALYATLISDPMYDYHKKSNNLRSESSNYAILSPNVPVFLDDGCVELDKPYLLDFVTCAAPKAYKVGQEKSSYLLKERIYRILAIAKAYGYKTLVLGPWGCGAFKNDVHRAAADFRQALEYEFNGVFEHVVFTVRTWDSDKSFNVFKATFSEEYEPNIVTKEIPSASEVYKFTNSKIELVIGDIAQQQADVIVNAAHSGLTGGYGVDGAIHSAAGSVIKKECLAIKKDKNGYRCQPGGVKVTSAGKLDARYIVHAVGPKYSKKNVDIANLHLEQVYGRSLQVVIDNDCQSIAFPSIATGFYHFPIDEAAQIAINVVREFFDNHSETLLVRFVLYKQKDFDIYKQILDQ